jgi:iron complex transport system substrate-binding protein
MTLPPHLRTVARSHLRTPASSHLRTPAPSHLRTPAPSHLRTPAPSHLRTPAPSHRSIPAPPHLLIFLFVILASTSGSSAPPQRIVSLVPAVTEMIFTIGEGGRLVGVSNYDRFPPEVTRLARVGGLLDPDVERILALRPDLVVLYTTQNELKQRLDRVGIAYYSYEHRTLSDITATLRAVGARIGSATRADTAAAEMERQIASIRAAAARLPRPRTLLVFGRDPSSLHNIDASGGYGFLHDMLEAAGGDDVFGDIRQQSVQASTEMIIARRPDVIVELHYGEKLNPGDTERTRQAWNALGSVPAVRNHRVYVLVGDEFVVPGPRIVQATRELAHVLHPEVR